MKILHLRQKIREHQKGVTFLEILAVLVILVLIYLAYARSFGQGTDKAKLSDVQNSFKQYQTGFENAMTENAGLPSANGVNTDYVLLNKYLGKDYQITSPTNGTGSTYPASNPIQTTNLKDPWGNPYLIQAKYVSTTESLLLLRSSGRDKKNGVTNDLFYDKQTGTDIDEVFYLTDYKNGTITSCTKGLNKDLGLTTITGAGLSTVSHDVPLSMRQTYENSYKYEYAVDATIFDGIGNTGTGSARTYFFSNTPLQLGFSNNSQTLTYNHTFDGFNNWGFFDDGYGGTVGGYYSSPYFFTNNTSGYKGDMPSTDVSHYTAITDISGGIPSSPYTIMGCK